MTAESFPGAAHEWLEADGLGGFASATIGGPRTRRYHGVLLAATTPPGGRMMLVNGFDAHVETPAGRFAISSQRYAPPGPDTAEGDVVHPDGASRLISFRADPWPHWRYRLDDGTIIEQELFVTHGAPRVVLLFRVVDPQSRVQLEVTPFLSGRDFHSLQHENAVFDFGAVVEGERLTWTPYPGVPSIHALHNGSYREAPDWYRQFLYAHERERGLDYLEDLAAPGVLRWDLNAREAVLLLGTAPFPERAPAAKHAADLQARELNRRGAFATRLERAADSYLVKRGVGGTIIAGYPWFGDWGRDTFIALRGLCLATGRLAEARDILLEWTGVISEGMLPNRFADGPSGQAGQPGPEYNAVDASLWFIVVARELIEAAARAGSSLTRQERGRLADAADAILEGYAQGTRHHIHLDGDGLIAAGEAGVQLTWMDAKVGHWVVTPRVGKPVEIQALWINALAAARGLREAGSRGADSAALHWRGLEARARKSFGERFWNEEGGFLFDVVDVDHDAGTVDASFRPNQLFAAGGLPEMILDLDRARRVVDEVERRLWTPMGPRSLAPDDWRYVARYQGGRERRDGGYHQGTVWPWLAGAFVEAWVRTRQDEIGNTQRVARERFLKPLMDYAEGPGMGHICEIADGEAPHAARGCPFQAWSVGEALRLSLKVLASEQATQPEAESLS